MLTEKYAMSNLSEEEFKEPDPPPSSPEVNPTAKGARYALLLASHVAKCLTTWERKITD